MIVAKSNSYKKHRVAGSRRKVLLPASFLLLSFLLMILPLEGVVSSVKAVLSYVFIPQIRLAHGTVKYAQGVSQTVLAQLSNVGLRFLCEVEHGKSTVRFDKLLSVLTSLGITLRLEMPSETPNA